MTSQTSSSATTHEICREDQRLSSESKIVSKYCNILKNSRGEGGGPSTPPSLPLYHVGNTSLRVRPKQICVVSFLYSYKDDLLENLGKIKPVSKNAKNRRPAWSVKKSKRQMNNRDIFRQCIFASLVESSPR